MPAIVYQPGAFRSPSADELAAALREIELVARETGVAVALDDAKRRAVDVWIDFRYRPLDEIRRVAELLATEAVARCGEKHGRASIVVTLAVARAYLACRASEARPERPPATCCE